MLSPETIALLKTLIHYAQDREDVEEDSGFWGYSPDALQTALTELDAVSGAASPEPIMDRFEFCIDGGTPFPGYRDGMHFWNGWECPWFEFSVVEEIAKAFPAIPALEYGPADSCDVVIEDGKVFLVDFDGQFEVVGVEHNTEDGKKILYDVGAGYWVWEIADD